MIHPTIRRAALLFVCVGTGLALLTGCSSTSSNEAQPSKGATTSATPTKGTPTKGTPTSSVPGKAPKSGGPSASLALGECTKPSILAALPAGSTMDEYECAIVSPAMWAAAKVKPGPTVFFLQNTSGPWKVSTADQVCGNPPAGLPKEILGFCPKP